MSKCRNVREVKDKIVMEQLIDTLPNPVRIYVRGHKPKSSGEAGELADNYIQARGTREKNQMRRCHRYGKIRKAAKPTQ